MKKSLLLLIILISLFSCTKKQKNEYKKINAYSKEMNMWAISQENDFGKKISDINEKINLSFGDPVTIINEKKINGMDYYRIKVKNNKNEYWIRKDFITEKFIVINKKDTMAYAVPDENHIVKASLQPGDFGIFIKEQGNWLNVNFWAYREKIESNKKEFVGNMWIKKGNNYTENIDEVKEAYYLYFAYYYYYAEKNLVVANNSINKALEISSLKKKDSEITKVIKEFQNTINK